MAGKDFCRLFDNTRETRHEAKPQHVMRSLKKEKIQSKNKIL
jgi:hypothetical protein